VRPLQPQLNSPSNVQTGVVAHFIEIDQTGIKPASMEILEEDSLEIDFESSRKPLLIRRASDKVGKDVDIVLEN
jgi:hypothetical protein